MKQAVTVTKYVRAQIGAAKTLTTKKNTTKKNHPERPTPNQQFQAVVQGYFRNLTKMSKQENFLQDLPTQTANLKRIVYVEASPYEHLFVYERLSQSHYSYRRSYKKVRRKYLIMRH